MRRAPPLLVVAGALVILLGLAALLAPAIAPYEPAAQSVVRRLKGPSGLHWLGTDQFGRDTLSRILYGLRASLAISAVAVAAALLVGGTLGLISAYFGGWTDLIVMRLMDVLFAFQNGGHLLGESVERSWPLARGPCGDDHRGDGDGERGLGFGQIDAADDAHEGVGVSLDARLLRIVVVVAHGSINSRAISTR